ncbi:MAG: MFS transporter [Candidatus Limnocylindrales bacterium]
MFAALRVGSFRWLWASGLLSGFAMYASLLVLSWLALGTQGSTLAVGVLLAARVLPQLLFGLTAGALADRFSRSHLVAAANVGSGAVLGLLCFASLAGLVGLPVLATGAFLVSAFDTVRVTAGSAMAFDVVGPRSATNAIALSNLAVQVAGIFAGIVAGIGLATLGPTVTLLVAAMAYLAGAALVPRGVPAPVAKINGAPVALGRAALAIVRNRQVVLIAIVVAGAEVFAFSNMTLLPSFARDVFGIGAAGLGWLLSARAVGGTIGLLAIATTSSRWRTVGSFALLAGAFGVALIAFAITPLLVVALILAGVIGAAGAAVDAIGQAQLQHAVAEAQRGAAMGIWMFCLGLGLAGLIETGVLGGLLGAPFAQSLNGAILIVLAVLVGAALPAISGRREGSVTNGPEPAGHAAAPTVDR